MGYLDDLIITPFGLALAIRLIPPDVLAECREKARATMDGDRPTSRAAAAVIVAIWLLALALAVVVVWRLVRD